TELAERGRLPGDAAREVIGAAHVLSQRSPDNQPLRQQLDRLKQTVYGTTEVEPTTLWNQVDPDDLGAPLHNESHTFEWQGMPIHVRALVEDASVDPSLIPRSAMLL